MELSEKKNGLSKGVLEKILSYIPGGTLKCLDDAPTE